MEQGTLAEFGFKEFVAGAALGALDAYAEGSRNSLLLGALSEARPWKGLQSKGASTGSRKMMTVGKRWGGIKDIGGTQGSGSLFEDFGRSLWMVGAGQPSIEGADLAGITLSTSLKVSIAAAGVYSAANTFTAGLGQPSAPEVGIVPTPGAGFTGLIKGPVSVKVARFRSSTGGRSRASTTSVVITPSNQSIRITFPAAASGQDYWHVFITQAGFGGVGVHWQLAVNGSLDIAESAVAAGTVDGVGRSIEVEFKDGDLFPVAAYVDDFAPPAGTHAARIGQSMVVLGAYGDSSSAVSSTSPGTMGAVSLPNFYESYRPRDLVAFPEQIVDVLGREWDDHGYVIHKNAVTTLQYVGLRDGPAVAAGVAWPDVGFQHPHCVTQFFGRLAGIVGRGSLVLMKPDGAPDFSWGDKIRPFIRDWTPEDTKVGFHLDNKSLVVMNGGVAFNYSLENNSWSPPSYFADAGVSGSALSCVSSQGELIVSVNNGGAHTAYSWDAGASAMPVTSITGWRRVGSPATVHEILAEFDCDSTSQPLIVTAHANMRKVYARDATTTSGSSTIGSATASFDSGHVGDVVCVFGANVGGAGAGYLIGRIATVPGATSVTIVNHLTGGALTAGATLSNCYMLIAHDITTLTLTRAAQQHTPPLTEFLVRDAMSFAVGVHMQTAATRGQVLGVSAAGTVGGERVSRTV
jgi:hypothetical protein